jgi:2-iminoacetate synthase
MIPYIKTDKNEIEKRLKAANKQAILHSLNSAKPGMADLINLISPAASPMINQIAKKAAQVKKMHYGKTVKLYTPLYLSNYCINRCTYCGFNCSSGEKRRRLSIDEALHEAEAIKEFGMDSILLVSGEDPSYISIEYLEAVVKKMKKLFSYIAIEIYPMSMNDYKRLFNAGVDGLTLYQETYDRPTYDKFHLSGPKADYDFRLESMINGGEAGFRNLGIGVLLGLYDWRLEAFSLAAHAMWLKKKFWKSKIQFSFPRITVANDDFNVPAQVSEKELEQMILAFRIIFPESEISVSTRESCEFRNHIAPIAASTMSAASSVIPGGYADESQKELGQFSLHDTRSAKKIAEDLKKTGLDVVYKDWDCVFAQ